MSYLFAGFLVRQQEDRNNKVSETLAKPRLAPF